MHQLLRRGSSVSAWYTLMAFVWLLPTQNSPTQALLDVLASYYGILRMDISRMERMKQ